MLVLESYDMVVVQVRESSIDRVNLPHALSGCDNNTVALGSTITPRYIQQISEGRPNA